MFYRSKSALANKKALALGNINFMLGLASSTEENDVLSFCLRQDLRHVFVLPASWAAKPLAFCQDNISRFLFV